MRREPDDVGLILPFEEVARALGQVTARWDGKGVPAGMFPDRPAEGPMRLQPWIGLPCDRRMLGHHAIRDDLARLADAASSLQASLKVPEIDVRVRRPGRGWSRWQDQTQRSDWWRNLF